MEAEMILCVDGSTEPRTKLQPLSDLQVHPERVHLTGAMPEPGLAR